MDEIVIKDTLRITLIGTGDDRSMVQLVLNEYLDTYNSPDFQNHVKFLINSGIKTILFNCGGLNYISSTGIGAFITFFKQLKSKSGDMVLFNLQNKVMDVFQILVFTRFFKIALDLDGALKLVERVAETTSSVSNPGWSGLKGAKKTAKVRKHK